ncbi:hypothetical protein ACFY5J_26935 [Peribacillus butanolivorans]|uniref:hypothetical protein n=1 Tax=Peribacillus butanolivorans TaxID=421767 RepID=UPI0036A18395
MKTRKNGFPIKENRFTSPCFDTCGRGRTGTPEESLELPNAQDEAKLVFNIVARKYNLQLAERRQINGFGKVDIAIHQAKIDGKYVPQATLVYDYMVDGHELNAENTDDKSDMSNF